MQLLYCSNKTKELIPDVFIVDTVLNPNIESHAKMSQEFALVVSADMDDPTNVKSVHKSAVAKYFVIAQGVVRKIEDTDLLTEKKVLAKKVIREQRDVKLEVAVASTSIKGSNGLPIRMDARYKDKANIECLLAYMKNKGLEQATIVDADNNRHQLSLNSIKTLLGDMLAYDMFLIQEKWEKCTQVDEALSFAELAKITGREDLFTL